MDDGYYQDRLLSNFVVENVGKRTQQEAPDGPIDRLNEVRVLLESGKALVQDRAERIDLFRCFRLVPAYCPCSIGFGSHQLSPRTWAQASRSLSFSLTSSHESVSSGFASYAAMR